MSLANIWLVCLNLLLDSQLKLSWQPHSHSSSVSLTSANVGNNSCIGGIEPGYDGYTGYACYNFIAGPIGNGSCNKYAACYQQLGSYILAHLSGTTHAMGSIPVI